ncbi:hypothetical protein HMPREF9069_00853 [Atopobium sp. oral taxon 810 str. F0209]|nr:hypothetical protein HMPREF9069_00853 [Atopobium sp. oral taxon 810 str. F0209]
MEKQTEPRCNNRVKALNTCAAAAETSAAAHKYLALVPTKDAQAQSVVGDQQSNRQSGKIEAK